MKINTNTTINTVNTMVIKLLEAAITLLDNIGYDYVSANEYEGGSYDDNYVESYEPCYVHGRRDPNFAWAERSRAQGMIYTIMEGLGMPLYGWNQFDTFVWALENGTPFDGAYKTAQCAQPQYRIKGILGGDGSKENPFVFEF